MLYNPRVATMDRPDRAKLPHLNIGSGDRTGLLFFLSCFNTDWQGTIAPTAQKPPATIAGTPQAGAPPKSFDRRLDICPGQGENWVFRLFFARDFSVAALYYDERPVSTAVQYDIHAHGCHFQRDDVKRTITQAGGQLPDYPSGHPYRVLIHWLASKVHPKVPTYKRQLADMRRRNFEEEIAELPGWTNYVTTRPTAREGSTSREALDWESAPV